MAMTEPHLMRLGTLNVRTLTGRLSTVLSMGVDLGVDILFVQESRVPDASWGAVLQGARSASQGVDAQNQTSGGTLCFSRWPAEAVELPADLLPPGRGMAVRILQAATEPLPARFGPGVGGQFGRGCFLARFGPLWWETGTCHALAGRSLRPAPAAVGELRMSTFVVMLSLAPGATHKATTRAPSTLAFAGQWLNLA